MAAVASVSDSNTPSHGVSGQPSAGSPTSGRLSDAPCEPGAAAAGSIDGAAAALAAHQCSGPAAWACRSAALKHRFRIPGVTPKSPFGASPWIRYPSPGPHGPVGSGSVSATAMSTGSPGKSSQGSVGSDHNGSPFGRILNMYSVGVAGAARASPLSSGGASPVGGDPDDAPRGVVFCGTCGCWRKAKHGRCVPCSAAAAADVAEAWAATPFARRAASTPSPAVTTMTATTQPAAKRYRSEASARTAVDQDDEDLRSLAGTLLGLRDSAVSTPPAPSRPRAGSSGGNTSPASLHDKTGGPSSMTSPSGVTDPVVTPQRVPTSRAGLSASGRPLRAAAMRTRSRSIEDAVECGAGAGAGGAAGQFEAEGMSSQHIRRCITDCTDKVRSLLQTQSQMALPASPGRCHLPTCVPRLHRAALGRRCACSAAARSGLASVNVAGRSRCGARIIASFARRHWWTSTRQSAPSQSVRRSPVGGGPTVRGAAAASFARSTPRPSIAERNPGKR